MRDLYNKLMSNQVAREGILYLIIGGSAVTLDAIIFMILYNIGNLDPVVSTIISITFATIFSFILNAKYNFKKEDKVAKRLVLFSLVSAFGMLVSSTIIKVCEEKFGIDPNYTKIISIPIIAVLQFVLNKLITFK